MVIYEVEITIQGETNVFSSNAQHYFACGSSIKNCSVHFRSYFGDNKLPVGGYAIYDRDQNKRLIDFGSVSLLGFREEHYAPDVTLKMSSCNGFRDSTDTVSGWWRRSTGDPHTPLKEEQITCSGLSFKQWSGEDWYWADRMVAPGDPPLLDESEFSGNRDKTVRNKDIQFIFEPLISISNGQIDYDSLYDTYYYVALEKVVEQEGGTSLKLRRRRYDELNLDGTTTPPYVKAWEAGESGRNPKYRFLDLRKWRRMEYGQGTQQYITTTLSTFQRKGRELEFKLNDGMGCSFIGYFTTEPSLNSRGTKQFLVTSDSEEGDVPIYKWGTVLYPVFTPAQCAYVKLNTDRESDTDNVLGDDTQNDAKIFTRLTDVYGQNFTHKNVNTWGSPSTVSGEI